MLRFRTIFDSFMKLSARFKGTEYSNITVSHAGFSSLFAEHLQTQEKAQQKKKNASRHGKYKT